MLYERQRYILESFERGPIEPGAVRDGWRLSESSTGEIREAGDARALLGCILGDLAVKPGEVATAAWLAVLVAGEQEGVAPLAMPVPSAAEQRYDFERVGSEWALTKLSTGEVRQHPDVRALVSCAIGDLAGKPALVALAEWVVEMVDSLFDDVIRLQEQVDARIFS